MRAAFIGFAMMLVFGAGGSAAARVLILDAKVAPAPAVAPISSLPASAPAAALAFPEEPHSLR